MKDTIYRADAIEAVRKIIPVETEIDSTLLDKAEVIVELSALPSAEAVQGEWIFRTDIPIGGGRESAGYVCSNCRKDYFHVDGMNFCPNCGAKMTKGGDE